MLSLEYSHEQVRLLEVISKIPKNSLIADIGCGRGRNLDLLRKMGFKRLVGVDINSQLRSIAARNGHHCLSPEEFTVAYSNKRVDVLLMSHIIEHFSHNDLLRFLECYLNLLKRGGQLIIVTPLMSDAFYNDFDHVRPYMPQGFGMVFAQTIEQVQFQSEHVLRACDVRFYRAPFRLHLHSTFYVDGGSSLPKWVNRMSRLIFLISAGLLGYHAGWIGRFEYEGLRIASEMINEVG